MNDSTTESGSRSALRLPRAVTIGVAALVIIAAGWYAVHKYRARAAAGGEYIFAPVERGDIEDLVTATGSLQPHDYVDVGAQVSGQVTRIYVDVGATVKKGDLLADIDATQSEARVDADRANLAAQQSQLVDKQNSLEKAERDYQRQLNLKKDDATTDETVQNALTTLNSARAAIVTLKAQIEQQKASMRVEETTLKYTKIQAPMAGTVVSITAKQGQTLNATQTTPTILRIADLTKMDVQTQVSEADVSKLATGMRAYFTTLGSQTRRWYGTLIRIDPTPTVQNNVVLYNALFQVQNEGNQLLPSMTAQVFFVRAEARNVLVVPMAALQQGQQYMRDKNAAAKKNGTATAVTPAQGAAAATAQNAGAPAGAAPAAAAAPNAAGGPPAGGGNGGGFNGQRPGGGFGGFNNGQPPTPEQIEQFRRMREQRMAERQGQGAAQATRRREGVVLVKTADGKIETRNVVVGVTDRVHGEVISGLKEGEEVAAGRKETEAAPAAQNNNNNRQGNFGGGFPGGGFPGGGARPAGGR